MSYSSPPAVDGMFASPVYGFEDLSDLCSSIQASSCAIYSFAGHGPLSQIRHKADKRQGPGHPGERKLTLSAERNFLDFEPALTPEGEL